MRQSSIVSMKYPLSFPPRERQHIMAPSTAAAWSDRAHGTSKSNIELIQARLLITEAGMATTEAHLIMLKVENLNGDSQAHARAHTSIIIFGRCRAADHRRCFTEPHHFKTGKYQLSNGNEGINSNDLRLSCYQRAFLIRQEKIISKTT